MQVLYLLSYVGPIMSLSRPGVAARLTGTASRSSQLERETGFEPATLSLEG